MGVFGMRDVGLGCCFLFLRYEIPSIVWNGIVSGFRSAVDLGSMGLESCRVAVEKNSDFKYMKVPNKCLVERLWF